MTEKLPKPQRVLYVVSRFPWTSTTFTTNEMAVIAGEGVQVFVAPVWKTPADHTPHALEKPFLSNIIRPQWKSPRTWWRIIKGLFRRPQVIGVIAQMVPGHLISPYLPFKLLASIPKGIFLGQWCVENQIDHIHAHFLTSPTTVALIASVVSGVPYSYTAHAFDITSQHPKSINGSIPLKCLRAALGVTISEYNRRYLLEHWPEISRARLEVIYNGIDTGMFQVNGVHTADNRPRRVLSVSRLEAKKGQDILIKAVALLREKGIDVRLDIWGDGEQRHTLQTLIDSLGQGEFIQLHGPIVQEALVEEYRKADIFALASVLLPWGDADGLPTVLIEALAVELPTISTQVTGIPEIIRQYQTGLCVPPGDVDRLADAIEWMLNHPSESQAMGQQGRQLVIEQFDRRHNAKHLLSLWRELHAQRTEG